MVSHKKILHQTSAFGPRKRGIYRDILYKVVRTQLIAGNQFEGIAATFTEVNTEISGNMQVFVAKRWDIHVTEEFADFFLNTNEDLNVDPNDSSLSDRIEYRDVRYRIVRKRHHNLILNDDNFDYALIREVAQAGGV